MCVSVCVFESKGVGGGRERERERKISDSLIKDVSKTLIKIEYPCKCKATCNLQVFHLEQLSQCEVVFYVFLHCTQMAIPFRFIFHTATVKPHKFAHLFFH